MARSTAIIILAAGGSTRLGRPKQQLVFGDKTLLERIVQAGLDSQANRLLLVWGANDPASFRQRIPHQVEFLFNSHWKQGMASSIKVGVQELMKGNIPDQVIITVCDQPYVDHKLIDDLISRQQATGRPIVACSYRQTLGVPALFDRTLFPELMALTGQQGAKKIIHQNIEKVAPFPFPLGHIDIDTPRDYEALLNTNDRYI